MSKGSRYGMVRCFTRNRRPVTTTALGPRRRKQHREQFRSFRRKSGTIRTRRCQDVQTVGERRSPTTAAGASVPRNVPAHDDQLGRRWRVVERPRCDRVVIADIAEFRRTAFAYPDIPGGALSAISADFFLRASARAKLEVERGAAVAGRHAVDREQNPAIAPPFLIAPSASTTAMAMAMAMTISGMNAAVIGSDGSATLTLEPKAGHELVFNWHHSVWVGHIEAVEFRSF